MNTSTPDEQAATYEDGYQAGRNWPSGAVPTVQAPAPIPTVDRAFTRCIHCGNEYDLNVTGREAGGTRCPLCTRLTSPGQMASPATAADSIERGRNEARNYNPASN